MRVPVRPSLLLSPLWCVLLALGVPALGVAQGLVVEGTINAGDPDSVETYHALRQASSTQPVSGEVTTDGDLFVEFDLELGDVLALSTASSGEEVAELEGQSSVPDRLDRARSRDSSRASTPTLLGGF